MPATTVFQLSPNRCRNFRKRSEPLTVLRFARLAPKGLGRHRLSNGCGGKLR